MLLLGKETSLGTATGGASAAPFPDIVERTLRPRIKISVTILSGSGQ
nr:MAG TPA: hypothetical protein [Caudoviricetes sp.]